MKKHVKRGVFVFLIIAVAAASCLITSAIKNGFAAGDPQTPWDAPVTALQVTVKDLLGRAVEGATVTIAESGESFTTDSAGKTPVMTVPFLETPLTKTVDGGFSFVTVVVTRQGYVDYILYNCLVYRSRTRCGPSITLFTVTQTSSPFVSTVEVPPEDWTKEFLRYIKDKEAAQ